MDVRTNIEGGVFSNELLSITKILNDEAAKAIVSLFDMYVRPCFGLSANNLLTQDLVSSYGITLHSEYESGLGMVAWFERDGLAISPTLTLIVKVGKEICPICGNKVPVIRLDRHIAKCSWRKAMNEYTRICTSRTRENGCELTGRKCNPQKCNKAANYFAKNTKNGFRGI